jgi:hypothetical protein
MNSNNIHSRFFCTGEEFHEITGLIILFRKLSDMIDFSQTPETENLVQHFLSFSLNFMAGSRIISKEQALVDFFCSEDEYAAADFVFKIGPAFYARQQMSDNTANIAIIIASFHKKLNESITREDAE